MKNSIGITAALAVGFGLAAAAHADTNLVTNPNFVGTGGVGGYGEFFPDQSVSANKKPAYAVDIAGWNAPQTNAINQNAPFLFSVDPTTIDTTGFYDSWDQGTRTLWGKANGGAEIGSGIAAGPPNGATSALLLDADYNITPIYQVIDPSKLTVGDKYTISFDYAIDQWAQNSGPTTEGIEIGLGGRVVQVASINPTTGVNGFSLASHTFEGWTPFSATFTYTGNPTTMTYGLDYGGETFTAAANWLTFIGEGSPQGLPPTILLTGVSLTQAPSDTPDYINPGVPEPATWALMMIGIGGLGAIARRRRAAGLAAVAA